MRSIAPEAPAALPIGELSRRTGVHIETIRYYERARNNMGAQDNFAGRLIDIHTATAPLV